MRFKTPSFWYSATLKDQLIAAALLPSTLIYKALHNAHQAHAKPYVSSIPVICIGNLTAGGSGKTPVALAVMKLIKDKKFAANPCFLTRGYGGTVHGPLLVNTAAQTAAETGDEARLLSRVAPIIISADRATGAKFAEQSGYDLIIMDDGLQNPGLAKTVSLVVIDGPSGFGNGYLLPAGPLRETVASGTSKADAFIIIGEDRHNLATALQKPIFRARLQVTAADKPDQHHFYIAFTGLGRPEKFRATIAEQSLTLTGWHAFPDHYNFTAADLQKLDQAAAATGARLLTTEKDAARLPPDFKWTQPPVIMPVQIAWETPDYIENLLAARLKKS